jgi:hypothetical protein
MFQRGDIIEHPVIGKVRVMSQEGEKVFCGAIGRVAIFRAVLEKHCKLLERAK